MQSPNNSKPANNDFSEWLFFWVMVLVFCLSLPGIFVTAYLGEHGHLTAARILGPMSLTGLFISFAFVLNGPNLSPSSGAPGEKKEAAEGKPQS